MQTVSDSFKKAIKSDNREIHGYVEVVYDEQVINNNYSATTFPTPSNLSLNDCEDIIDGVRIMKNYATLENNYFLLDGSFMLPNKNTLYDSGGYVSNDIYENIQNNSIVIDRTGTIIGTKGLTLFFKDNIPFDFDIEINGINVSQGTTVNDNISIRDNTQNSYQIIFEYEINIQSITLMLINVEYPNRRIRIPDISFGLVSLYEGDELVSFDVNQEIDINGLSIPIDTCVININNYPDENGNMKFDPLNPTGIVPYLTDNVEIKPYIGVLTDANSIEYKKMGIFYLKDWSSDNDGNVTLNGVSGMEKIKNSKLHTDGTNKFLARYFAGSIPSHLEELNELLTNMTGFEFDIESLPGVLIYNFSINYTTLEKWLFTIMPFILFEIDSGTGPLVFLKKFFHLNKDNIVKLDYISDLSSIYNIPRSNMLNDVKYTQLTPINKFIVTYDQGFSNTTSSEKDDLLKIDSYSLPSDYSSLQYEEYVWYKLDKKPGSPSWASYSSGYTLNYTASGNGSVEIIDGNLYMVYLKYTGANGETFSNITLNGYIQPNITISSRDLSRSNKDKIGDTISINFAETAYVNEPLAILTSSYYLRENKYNYKINTTTIGDPALECGDKIKIQTRYTDNEDNGYKDIIITKQHFKFDGGLTCDLEGVGN